MYDTIKSTIKSYLLISAGGIYGLYEFVKDTSFKVFQFWVHFTVRAKEFLVSYRNQILNTKEVEVFNHKTLDAQTIKERILKNKEKVLIVECLKDSLEKNQLNMDKFLNQQEFVIEKDRDLSTPFPACYGTIVNSKILEDMDFPDCFLLTKVSPCKNEYIQLEDLELVSLIHYEDKGENDPKLVVKRKVQSLSKEEIEKDLKSISYWLLNYKAPIINTINRVELNKKYFEDSVKDNSALIDLSSDCAVELKDLELRESLELL